MRRLQTKCFIASCGLHGLLLGVVAVGAAFLVTKPNTPETPPVLEYIPAKLVDSALHGGGQPKPIPPAPAPAPPPTAPPPAQKVEPAPLPKKEPVIEKPPVKEALLPAELKEAKKPPAKTVPEKSRMQIADTSKLTKRHDDSKKRAEPEKESLAEQERNTRALAQARADKLKLAMSDLNSSLSPGLRFEPAGPGGEAFANYGQAVITVYQNAWVLPDDVTDDNQIVGVTVTIHRDGSVLHASILKRSGNASVDRSVQNALNRVKFIAPFPDGAKESDRTFNIDFNLKTRRQIG
ncbi:MAG: TonB family protein [Verrucomicrobia bacterium]|nr:TonB family protein [Verrucomicrobiota bacterium]